MLSNLEAEGMAAEDGPLLPMNAGAIRHTGQSEATSESQKCRL